MKRHGVALMLTLFMLLALSAALSITLALFQKGFTTYTANSFRIQSAVLIVDTVNIVASLAKEVGESPEAFEILMQSAQELPLRVGNVDMLVKLRPLGARFNINHYSREKHHEKLYAYLLDYNLQRPGYILDMIEDSLDADSDENQYGSERVLYDPFFVQGKIVDYSQFSKLLDTYAKETKDINIYKVPWHAWMSFEGEFLDERYLTPELIKVIETPGGESDEAADFDTLGENGSELNCELYLRQDEASSISEFDFNLKTKTISNFRAIL
jgi:hypothetical protein